MPNPSKRKGDGFEREVVDILKQSGLTAKKIPLSGAVEGFKGDIQLWKAGRYRTLECKRRRRGFATLYGWLADNYALVVRDDRTEPLVVMRLTDFAEISR